MTAIPRDEARAIFHKVPSEPLDLGLLEELEPFLPGYSSTPVLERLNPVPMKASFSSAGEGDLGGLSFLVFREDDLGSLSTMICEACVVGEVRLEDGLRERCKVERRVGRTGDVDGLLSKMGWMQEGIEGEESFEGGVIAWVALAMRFALWDARLLGALFEYSAIRRPEDLSRVERFKFAWHAL